MWFGLIFTGIFFIGIALPGIISKLRQLRKHCTVPLIAEIIRYDKHMRHYRGRDYKSTIRFTAMNTRAEGYGIY